ncbi:ABC transporter permease [Segeticoccus rhizosphaerae]|uniref:ABC transporter permease n=1 Tax=Segeticoccus rhizosphaerae TaxID=1104777 RepID=UPI00193AC235|nr:ABC transporter permease [Segeticoccus rhizosphaerae]
MAADPTLPTAASTRNTPEPFPRSRRWQPVFAFWATQYKRTWQGNVVSRFLMPVMFLLAMGLGLGSLVDSSSGGVDGMPYLQYVVPGILAAQSMWVAMGESSYTVLGAIRWQMQYHAMLATPIGVADILIGHIGWVASQIALATGIFLAVGAAFGAWASWWVLLALPLTVLTGLAFTVPVFAFAATQENDAGFSIMFRFVMTPLFLFSGTFFPLDQLPAFLRPIAWVTPLWHGVDGNRDLATGSPDWLHLLGHTAYLLLVVVVTGWLAYKAFRRRLVV